MYIIVIRLLNWPCIVKRNYAIINLVSHFSHGPNQVKIPKNKLVELARHMWCNKFNYASHGTLIRLMTKN